MTDDAHQDGHSGSVTVLADGRALRAQAGAPPMDVAVRTTSR